MKILAPSLALLVGIALAPSLSAAHIEDRDLKLSMVFNLQPRAEAANAKTASGDNDFDLQTGATGEQDDADFYLRRFRTGFKGSYQDNWHFAGVINADDAGRANQATRTLTVHQGYIGRSFTTGEVTQLLQGGLDYAFFNHAVASNSAALFPNQRASAALMPVRGIGGAYRVSAPMVHAGFDVQNNLGDDGASSGAENEGLIYTGRIELTGPGDLALTKFQETYLTKEGLGFILGVEGGWNDDDRIANTSVSTGCYGVDVMIHWEGFNALAEHRVQHLNGHDVVMVESEVSLAQIGYAFAAGPVILEPALRYTIIDLNNESDEENLPFGTRDYGNSGNQIEIGLNIYFNGHGNKLQLAYTDWQAEGGPTGADEADAQIIRLQHQLNF